MLADHLLKTKKQSKSLKTGDPKYIYRNELDKASFQHDMAYGDLKDLPRGTVGDKAFNTTKDSRYDGNARGLASMVYKCFDKKSKGSGIKSTSQNQQLAKELHQSVIKKFKKRKVYTAFKDNILRC